MGTPRSGTRGIRRYGVPIALLSTLFAAATFLNSLSAYPIVLGGLALLCGAVAAIDEDAAALLVVGTPALDAHGIFLRLPQAVTVFQVVLVCALLGFAWRFVRGTRRPPLLATWLDAGVVLLVCAAALSVLLSAARARSLVGFVEVACLAGMYLVLSRSAVDAPRRAAVAGTVVVAAAYSALIAVAQGFLGSRLVPLLERHETGSEVLPLRASAFFADPNSLAVLLVLGALLALEACFRADSFRRAAPYLAAIVVSLAGIGATFSREAVVGLVVGGAAVLVFTPRPGRAALAGVVVVVIAAIGVLSVSGVGERVASILSPQKDTSSMARVHLAEVSLKMFADRPLTGVGISAFSSAYPAYRDVRIPEEASVNTHSMPFGIPAEMGILGLLAEACAAGAACIMAVKSRFLARRGVGAGPVAAMLAFLAMSFFNSFLFIESFWTAAALAGAVLVAERVGALPWVAGRDVEGAPSGGRAAA